jgi:hypothetical protein
MNWAATRSVIAQPATTRLASSDSTIGGSANWRTPRLSRCPPVTQLDQRIHRMKLDQLRRAADDG